MRLLVLILLILLCRQALQCAGMGVVIEDGAKGVSFFDVDSGVPSGDGQMFIIPHDSDSGNSS